MKFVPRGRGLGLSKNHCVSNAGSERSDNSVKLSSALMLVHRPPPRWSSRRSLRTATKRGMFIRSFEIFDDSHDSVMAATSDSLLVTTAHIHPVC